MAGSMKQTAMLLLSLFVLSAQALPLFNIMDIVDDAMQLTSKGMKMLTGGSDGGMHVQMAPPLYGRSEGTPEYFLDKGSKRETLKYGPFSVQPMNESNGMVNYLQVGATLPCADCLITFMQASLEYPNGTYANANTSMWLHHTVFINMAHPDTVCGSDYYGKGQRWFASGNERTTGDWTLSGKIPVGYYVGLTDFHVVELELMNQQMAAQEAVMTVTYEYIPGGMPKGFSDLTPMWLDIAGCDTASDMPPKSNTTFSYSMNQTFTPNFTAALIGMGAHLHDGGTHLNITNLDRTVCESNAYYGGPGFVGPSMSMDGMSGMSDMDGMGSMMMDHISYMSSCYAPNVGMVTPQDSWNVKAFYDFTQHEGMTDTDGSLSDIMGIAVVYAAKDLSAADMAKMVGTYKADPTPPQPPSASQYMYPATTSMAMGGSSMTMSMDSTMTMSM